MLTVMEKVDMLLNAEIFREIPTQSLASIAAIAQEISFEPRQMLYGEGDAVDALYVLLDGEVTLASTGQAERKLSRFQIAGALSFLADLSYRETARASRLTRTLRIGQQDFFDLMAEDIHIVRGTLCALVGMVPVQC